MVGFDSSIKSPTKASKLNNPTTDPCFQFSFPDYPLFDPLPDFTWSDDWLMDHDDSLNLSILTKPVDFDFGTAESFIEAIEDSIEKPIQEAAVETPLVDGFGEKRVSGDLGLGTSIEKEMEKVSLIGGSESSKVVGEDPVQLENGDGVHEDGGNDVSLVVNSGNILKLEENGNGATTQVPAVGESKMEENRDVALVTNTGKDVATIKTEPHVPEKSIDEEDSDSSDSESDSDSSESETSSSESSSSSGSEEEEEEEKEKEKEMEVGEIEEGEIRDFDGDEILFGSDDEEGVVKGPIKSKNEIEVLPPVPQVNVTLEPHHQTLPVGVILSIMGAKVVVEGLEKHNPLNEGSILWITETRSPLGLVDEIFGPVKSPYYIVRYNSDEEVPDGVGVGTPVSFVAEFANHVLNDSNIYKKGYDASGENDEELSDEEFSDDEKEVEYRRQQKMAKNGGKDKKRGNQDTGNRKKVQQHKGTSWKNAHSSSQLHGPNMGQPSNGPNMGQTSNGPNVCHPSNYPSDNANMGHPSNNPNQFHSHPLGGTFSHGALGSGPNPVSVPVPGPPALQVPHANFGTPQNLAPPNAVWMNGMAFQPQQQMIFPNGLQMNGMQPQQLNQYQHPPQMFTGFLNGMQIQQQFDPSQRQGMAFPFGQSNFTSGPSTNWPGFMGPAAINQAQFVMGFQGQPINALPNAGEQGASSNAPFTEQSNESSPSSNIQGNLSAPHQFNQGATSTRGRRPYHRGGGNFSSRRGRQ